MRVVVALLSVAACGFSGKGQSPDDGPPATTDGAIVDGPNEIDGPPIVVDGPSPDWPYRRALVIDNTGHNAVSAFPLPVFLTASRVRYTSTGADLRFTDAAGTALPHEIESWNPAGTSVVWVRVDLPASAMATIYMYYGNANATDAQMPAAVWDSDFVGVWHLGDAHDSTGKNASANHSTTPGVGRIGGSTEFGAGTYIDTMSTAYLTRWSIEAWIRPAGGATQITNGTSIIAKFPNYLMLWSCNSSVFCKSVLMDGQVGAGTYHTSYSANAATWTHVAGTFDGVNLITYSSGTTVASTSAADTSVDTTATAKIGIRQDNQGFFTGGIDEVRISKVARELPYFIDTEKGARDALITYGSEEMNQ